MSTPDELLIGARAALFIDGEQATEWQPYAPGVAITAPRFGAASICIESADGRVVWDPQVILAPQDTMTIPTIGMVSAS